MSGHSKWANIRRRKEKEDKKKSKVFHKFSRELMVAARTGGGDPQFNPRLRNAMDAARSAGMSKDTIESAVHKASGEDNSVRYEEVTYEGYGPGGVSFYIEALTDNKHRTYPDIKRIFEKHNSALGDAGCVAWLFERKGYIVVLKRIAPEDKILEAILESDAQTYEERDDHYEIYTAPENFEKAKATFENARIAIEYSRIAFVPKTFIAPSADDAQKAQALADALDENDDVQNVWTNLDTDLSAKAESENAKSQ